MLRRMVADLARSEFERGILSNQLPPLRSIFLGEQRFRRNVVELRVPVIRVPVRVRQLQRLHHGVNVVGRIHLHAGKVVALQNVQRFNHRRTLAPEARLSPSKRRRCAARYRLGRSNRAPRPWPSHAWPPPPAPSSPRPPCCAASAPGRAVAECRRPSGTSRSAEKPASMPATPPGTAPLLAATTPASHRSERRRPARSPAAPLPRRTSCRTLSG